jgi:hypothetical protein
MSEVISRICLVKPCHLDVSREVAADAATVSSMLPPAYRHKRCIRETYETSGLMRHKGCMTARYKEMPSACRLETTNMPYI